MAWYNSIKDLGKSLGNAVKTVAAVGSVVPGPWTPYAKAITIGSNLFGGGSKNKAAQQAQNYTQQGADAQMAYQNAALKNYQNNMDRQIAISTADKQSAYDIGKGQFLSNQQNILPYQIASLSALQALPQLQQLLGVPAYSIPTTISQYTPPDVNYLNEYRKTGNAIQDTGKSDNTSEPQKSAQKMNPGLRVNIKVPDDVAQSMIDNGGNIPMPHPTDMANPNWRPSDKINPAQLNPYNGPAYNMDNSPIYQWQKRQADEALNAQLAAAGLSGSTYAQRELAREHQGLATNERNRVIGNLSSLANFGMGGSRLSQGTFRPPQDNTVGNIYGQGAQDIASIYGNMGAIQGNYAAQSAMNAIAANNANANKSPITDALQLAQNFGWLSGNKGSIGSIGDLGFGNDTLNLGLDAFGSDYGFGF